MFYTMLPQRSIREGRTHHTMYTFNSLKRITCITVVFITVLCFCSCSSDKMLNNTTDYLSNYLIENVNYEYVVRYEFSNHSDAEKVEQRLQSLEFTIVEKKKEGDVYEYRLQNHYNARDENFEVVSENHDACIVGNEKTSLISQKDAKSVSCMFSQITVEVSKELYLWFYHNYSEDVKIACLDTEVEASHVPKKSNNKFFVLFSVKKNYNDLTATENVVADEVAIKAAVMLSCEPLEGEVETEIIQSATFIEK